ncbi:unnamed protein product [Plutella xylostella]|uniref:(diamondback moth) hypothetical protein n=1 Tax=Plutella xylostella TaxID=51655 RepID=A0A8S4G589_PLUXY|nr:unnamed protein product [Plutella xylostella]
MIRAILFICRFIAIVAVVSGYILPKSCSDKYEQYVYKGREYILQNFPLRWEDARIMCRGHHNGTLAILDTEDKANYLAQALAESQYSDIDSVWLGARRSGPDDPHGYRWLDGGALRRSAADVVDGSVLRKPAADVVGEKGGTIRWLSDGIRRAIVSKATLNRPGSALWNGYAGSCNQVVRCEADCCQQTGIENCSALALLGDIGHQK